MQIDRDLRLSRIDVLCGLAAAQLASLEQRCGWRRCRRGRLVIDHQGADRDIYFLIDGAVRATVYSPSGRQVTFADIGPGGCFGDLSAIDGRPRSASVVALTDTTLATMSPRLFWDLIEEEPAFAGAMLKRLAGIVRRLDDRVVEFSTLSVGSRIRAELLRLARPARGDGGPGVISPIPRHADIASRVATNREAVTRELALLGRRGVIAREPGRWIIRDPERLLRMVEDGGDA